MTDIKQKTRKHAARVLRTRAKVAATSERPRLLVVRSNRYIYAQIIDVTGKVLAAATSLNTKQHGIEAAQTVGKQVAEKALAAGIKMVTFDRHGHRYHGNVKALAEAAREIGLIF